MMSYCIIRLNQPHNVHTYVHVQYRASSYSLIIILGTKTDSLYKLKQIYTQSYYCGSYIHVHTTYTYMYVHVYDKNSDWIWENPT